MQKNASAVPFAVILGTNELASAIALRLYRGGHLVVLSHDPLPPVIRRGMAFHDTLFDQPILLDGQAAVRVESSFEIIAQHRRAPGILVTELGLVELLTVGVPTLLIDARMQKYQTTPDLRHLARLTIGLGPSFAAGDNCDIAIETRPDKVGLILLSGAPEPADHRPALIAGRGDERFVRAPSPGRWHTALEIGIRVFKDYEVGFVDGLAVVAPFDGIIRGLARDGTEVPAGVKLLEIDPRGRGAVWRGVDARGAQLAKAVMSALALAPSVLPVRTMSDLP